MCGRYSLARDPHDIVERFKTKDIIFDFKKRYNAAPLQYLPIITNEQPDSIQLFRWGLVPSWAKDESYASKLINARAETVSEKPSFRNAYKRRRCLVLADGFYEWPKTGKRFPSRFTMNKNEIFAMAGLWEKWKDPNGKLINTFAIITTKANVVVEHTHHRMPVILAPKSEHLWLSDRRSNSDRENLLEPMDHNSMTRYTVSKRVNSPANDDSDLILKFEDERA